MSDCHHSEGEISKATAHSHPPTSTYRGELRVGNNQAAVTTTAHTVRSLSGGRQGALLHVLRLAPAALSAAYARLLCTQSRGPGSMRRSGAIPAAAVYVPRVRPSPSRRAESRTSESSSAGYERLQGGILKLLRGTWILPSAGGRK